MVLYTDKGNFRCFEDILTDMSVLGYDTIKINDSTAFGGSTHLGGVLGVVTKADIEKLLAMP